MKTTGSINNMMTVYSDWRCLAREQFRSDDIYCETNHKPNKLTPLTQMDGIRITSPDSPGKTDVNTKDGEFDLFASLDSMRPGFIGLGNDQMVLGML